MLGSIAATPSILAFALASAGLLSAGDPGIALALVVTSLAIAVLALVRHTPARSDTALRSLSRARRSIDISVPLAQSDPGAPGHSRPRAPGIAASAA